MWEGILWKTCHQRSHLMPNKKQFFKICMHCYVLTVYVIVLDEKLIRILEDIKQYIPCMYEPIIDGHFC